MAENARIEDLRKRLDKEPGSRLFAQLAEELRKDGQIEEAIRVARAGLVTHPTYVSARMTLGRALMDTGDQRSARTEFETVLRGAPDNILASRFLGECLEGLGDLGAALLQYKATLRLVPGGDRAVEAQIRSIEERLGSATAPRAAPGPPPAAAPAATPPPPVAAPITPLEPAAAPGTKAVPVPAVTALLPPEPAAGATVSPPPAALPATEATLVPESNFDLEAPFDSGGDTLKPQAAPPAATLARGPEPSTLPGVAVASREAPPTTLPGTSDPLASTTLAELYFSQGEVGRAVALYRELLGREPSNDRIRARLAELEGIDRHLRREEAPAPPIPLEGARLQRRLAIERTIARLEGLLAAVKRA